MIPDPEEPAASPASVEPVAMIRVGLFAGMLAVPEDFDETSVEIAEYFE